MSDIKKLQEQLPEDVCLNIRKDFIQLYWDEYEFEIKSEDDLQKALDSIQFLLSMVV